MFRTYEQQAASIINDTLDQLGYGRRELNMRPIPFAGEWGTSSSIAFQLANEVVSSDPPPELAELSKKQRKKQQQGAIREQSVLIGDQIAAALEGRAEFSRVESVNGYVNLYFNTNELANVVVGSAINLGERYGLGPEREDRVMVEFSQPNTHKEFHIGHARNASLGRALANITEFAGYPTQRANYIGDIGRHVIICLWCLQKFHSKDRVPIKQRGRWLGEIYAEANYRLTFQEKVVGLLDELASQDPLFVEKIDIQLRDLYQEEDGLSEDVAYLLGQITNKREIKPEEFYDPLTVLKFWPLVGKRLQEEIAFIEENGPVTAPPPVSRTANQQGPRPVATVENTTERYERWAQLNRHIDWWPMVPEWESEVRDEFQRWDQKDPEFVQLWEQTKEWSMQEFLRIYDELGIEFDVWFYESEVEEEGRQMVKELLEREIAEMSQGLTVVKIDEKLGLEEEKFRTLPILRSDGTTLYSTKDLSLTRRKFEDYQIDRSIWVVDVRQSLYFQQIFEIMRLWGFEQADMCYHLGYEMVTLPSGTMSSRTGNVVLYEDVAAAMKARAREIVVEKARHADLTGEQIDRIAEQVGIGSLIYSMVSRDNNTVIVFDLEESLSFTGHAAPYIQYAHARACRLLERAGEVPADEMVFEDLQPEEIDLIEQIGIFPSEVQKAVESYRPLVIADYVYELARKFNDFYADFDKRPILNAPEPQRTMRIALVAASRQTLANGLGLLGVAAPEIM